MNDDYGTSYYYSGDVTDNYIEYSNYCFRILRIQGDGTLKLILANEGLCSESDNTSALLKDTDGNLILTYYVRTTNSTAGSANYLEGTKENNLMYNIDNWFETKINDKTKVTKTKWCNGNAIKNTDTNGIQNYITKYMVENNILTLKCDEDSTSFEKYSAPITLLEARFTGINSSNTASIKDSFLSQNVYDDNNTYEYWTLSPFVINATNNGIYKYTLLSSNKGNIINTLYDYKTIGIRPMIVLNSDVKYSSGNGTKINPYKIK